MGGSAPPHTPLKSAAFAASEMMAWPIGPGSGPQWSLGPGLGRGPALVHGPRPGPWAWPIGPGSGPGPWAPAWARVRPWSMGPGPWPWPGEKKVFTFFLLKKVFIFFLDFISTVPGSVEMKSPPNGGHSISTFPGNVQIE